VDTKEKFTFSSNSRFDAILAATSATAATTILGNIRTCEGLAETPAILISSNSTIHIGKKNAWHAQLIGPVHSARLEDALIESMLRIHSRRRLSEPRLINHEVVNLPQSKGGRGGSLGDLRILVVDDQQPNCQVLLWLLKKLGYEHTESASSGFELLGNLDIRDYDVIFLDLSMPNMSGLEATRLIRARWPEKKVRIIGCTAYGNVWNENDCMSAGMDGFMLKPVTLNGLYDVMANLDENLPLLDDFSPALQNWGLRTSENEALLLAQQKLETIPEEIDGDSDDVMALLTNQNSNILKKTQIDIPPPPQKIISKSKSRHTPKQSFDKYMIIFFVCVAWILGFLTGR